MRGGGTERPREKEVKEEVGGQETPDGFSKAGTGFAQRRKLSQ